MNLINLAFINTKYRQLNLIKYKFFKLFLFLVLHYCRVTFELQMIENEITRKVNLRTLILINYET